MALESKYQELISKARSSGVNDLQAREQDNVLYIDGEAPTGAAKEQLWNIYNKLDPDYRAGDLVMNLDVASMAPGSKAIVTTQKSNLNIRKGPGVDQPIVGKAGHKEVVTLVSKADQGWWLIRTDAGEEGYASAQYLSPVS